MFNINSSDILSPAYNTEITDIVEKAWLKSSAATKEQREKNIHDIFRTFLSSLNKKLNEGLDLDLSDLILEKSKYITDSTGIFEWPSAETLKVPDLHRLTLYFYNYLKNHFALASLGKISKDLPFKAFENLVKFIESNLDSFSMLTEELIFSIFNDFFYFYKLARQSNNEETKEKSKMDMEDIINHLFTETSFQNLIKMESIDRPAQLNFLVGILTTLLNLKVSRFEENEEGVKESVDLIESASKHLKILKEYPIVLLEYSLVKNLSQFIYGNQFNLNLIEDLIKIFKEFKIYRKFRKSLIVGRIFDNFQSSAKYTLMLYFILAGIKIDKDILSFLNIKDGKFTDITGLDLNNVTLVKPLTKSFNLSLLTTYDINKQLLEKFYSLAEEITKYFNNNPLIKESELVLNLIFENNIKNEKTSTPDDLLSSVQRMNMLFRDIKKSLKLIK